MDNTNLKIGSIVEKEFDTRMEASVFLYILEKGIDNLSQVSEDEISKVKGDGFMTANFMQSLIRTAVKICKTYTPMEIMEYIRVSCHFSPFVKSFTLYKDYFTPEGWNELCWDLDQDEHETMINALLIRS